MSVSLYLPLVPLCLRLGHQNRDMGKNVSKRERLNMLVLICQLREWERKEEGVIFQEPQAKQ